MKWKVSALGLAAMVFLAALTAWAGKMLFEDKFTTFDPAWGESSDIVNVKDGKMVITPKNTTQLVLNHANLLPNDIEASVTATCIQSDGTPFSANLVFWAKGGDDFYTVAISPPYGRFAVSHWLAPLAGAGDLAGVRRPQEGSRRGQSGQAGDQGQPGHRFL